MNEAQTKKLALAAYLLESAMVTVAEVFRDVHLVEVIDAAQLQDEKVVGDAMDLIGRAQKAKAFQAKA